VLVIEHNLDIIKNSEWVVDRGPEGGEAGGRIIAQGTVAQVAAAKGSYTGEWLRKLEETEKAFPFAKAARPPAANAKSDGAPAEAPNQGEASQANGAAGPAAVAGKTPGAKAIPEVFQRKPADDDEGDNPGAKRRGRPPKTVRV
jgi:excinuclease ABC subunit A